MPVIGYLNSGSSSAQNASLMAAFHKGLGETGYVEGRNVLIEYRWANDQLEQLPALAADLILRQVAVICASPATAAFAAKSATATIPVVFEIGGDPVQVGLVASLARPGGNVTGVTFLTLELAGKRLGLLGALVPQVTKLAFLDDPLAPGAEEYVSDILTAVRTLGRQVIVLEVGVDHDFDAAFATLVQSQAGALVVGPYPLFLSNRDKILSLAERHKIPTIYNLREYPAAGGLMSYGASISDTFRQAGVYTGLILKGAKPADLPVIQPTKFELVINLKTAQALGLTVPPTLRALADEVIE
jgi:putative ABC transport system substrate-binding protein